MRKACFDERVNIAVKHALGIPLFNLGSEVFDHLIQDAAHKT